MSKLGKEGHNSHFGNCLTHKKTKLLIVVFPGVKKPKQNVNWEKKSTVAKNGAFPLERERDISLKYRGIRPSAVFETRRKAALRREGFAWVPDLRSLDKLLEVGVSPYLGFIPSLSTLRMFELNEAVRGRLIGPKPWDRIDMNI